MTINRGIQAIIRVINDIVNHLINSNSINPKEDKTETIFNEVKYYLDPFISFFSIITPEQRKDLRGFFGGGADTRFWRTFQKAIADKRSDFCPEGLNKYWEDEAKIYNEESSNYLRDIENKLKDLISVHLQKDHGQNWLIHGLPKTIYTKAKKDADDQSYDMIAKGESGESISIWDCVIMADCKDIITYGRNWSENFRAVK